MSKFPIEYNHLSFNYTLPKQGYGILLLNNEDTENPTLCSIKGDINTNILSGTKEEALNQLKTLKSNYPNARYILINFSCLEN